MALKSTIIVVNDEPYCVWGPDLKERNVEFLNGVDPGYFGYLIDRHVANEGEEPSKEEEKRASIVLRTACYHALETLFSLLGALLQAPDCVYGWVAKCSSQDLRALIDRINRRDTSIISKWAFKNGAVVSWDTLSQVVHGHAFGPTEDAAETRKRFGELWERLAHEFLDQDRIDEYNSFKHGFRIRSGGFALSMRKENSTDEFTLLGESKFGSSFFRVERIGSSRNLRSRRIALNWRIERVLTELQLLAMSIQNVTSALKIINGVPAEECRFDRSPDGSDFGKPWTYTPGVTRMSLDFDVPEEALPDTTKEMLLERVRKLIVDGRQDSTDGTTGGGE